MSLKQKTINGLLWSFLDNFIVHGVNFIAGIVLARLLSPREFGLVGMVTIFIALGQSFVDSGFGQALIRKKDCTQSDYSTIFIFNVIVGICWYILIIVFSPIISAFFNEPELIAILPVLGIGVILNAASIIHIVQLTKRIDFKLQTKISVFSSFISGISALIIAVNGFGVWSLVWMTLVKYSVNLVLLWFWNGWRPSLIFDNHFFKEMYGFGSRLLISGLIDTAYRNAYLAVIGKYYSASDLGYYSRADQFSQVFSSNISSVVQRVSYPVLSSVKEDDKKLKAGYQQLIKSTMLISFVLMIGLAAAAKPLILALIGEKWMQSVEYLQLLCFVGMFYPLHALNLNILNVKGRSDLFLRLEVIKKVISLPVIIVGALLSIKIMIIGMIIHSVIAYYINSYWSGKLIGYSFGEQIRDIIASFYLAIFMGMVVYSINMYFFMPPLITLFMQVIIGLLVVISVSEILKIEGYCYIKHIIFNKKKYEK